MYFAMGFSGVENRRRVRKLSGEALKIFDEIKKMISIMSLSLGVDEEL